MSYTGFNIGNAINSGGVTAPTRDGSYALIQRDGLDLIWLQGGMSAQMANIEAEIAAIEANANLSDTERMFAMQTAMNAWSAVTNLRTNMIKTVSDSLKAIVRNIAA